MLRPHLDSKVGRHLFVSFLLAALLPLGGLGFYAYFRVGDILVTSFDSRLQSESKTWGMNLVQELNVRARALKHIAERHGEHKQSLVLVPPGFLSVNSIGEPPNLTSNERRHLENGNALLRMSPGADAHLYLQSIDGEHLIDGQLDTSTLWVNDEAPERHCVITEQYQVYYCSASMHPPEDSSWIKTLSRSNAGTLSWRIGHDDLIAGYWRASLAAAYAHPGYIVLVAESGTTLEHELGQFRLIFISTAVLSFCLALLLALNQIRRATRPLDALTLGTQHLAGGDFSTRVQVAGNNEFSGLARSFNRMASHLSNKFHMLRMLADLDRAILSSSEMEYVVQAVLSHIHQSIPCDCAGILRLDDKGGGLFQYTCKDDPNHVARVWECTDVSGLLPKEKTETWHYLDWTKERRDCLPIFDNHRLQQVLIFPVKVNDRPDSLLILTYENSIESLDEIIQAAGSLTDRLAVASSNIAWEERLYHQAHYDALTDLPNRVLLRDRVAQALARADREHTSVALILVDLDNFKQVNDSLGHSAGDELIVLAGQRLTQGIRGSDTVARLGGDEFVLLIQDITRGDESAQLAKMVGKLMQALAEPMTIADRRLSMQASLGIALYPENATDFDDLLKMADAAMYDTKREQPGGFRFFSGEMNAAIQARFNLTQDLRDALDNNEFVLYYQPKVSVSTGEIIGAEALIRWQSPKHGMVPPGHFVPLLEEIGLIGRMGDWVLENTCAQMNVWDQAGLPPLTVSINLSPPQLRENGLIEKIVDTLERHKLPHHRLELEIIESSAVDSSSSNLAVLEKLRALDIGIALDDFGTGYSSLIYLTNLPANVLKLDRGFISTLSHDPRQRSIVERIIALAHILNFSVVAEGVEEFQQMELLAEMGCDLVQGYLFSPPIPAADFENFLRAGKFETANKAGSPTRTS